MEVLARRYDRILWLHAFYILSGIGLVVGGGFVLRESVLAGVTMILMGCTVEFFGVFLTVLLLRTPEKVAEYDGKRIYFGDFSCYPWELNEISFSTPSRETYGTLYIRAGETRLRYRFVAEVETACDNLKALKSRSRTERNKEE